MAVPHAAGTSSTRWLMGKPLATLVFIACVAGSSIAQEPDWTLIAANGRRLLNIYIEANRIFVSIEFSARATVYECVNGVGAWYIYENPEEKGNARCMYDGVTIELDQEDGKSPGRWVKTIIKRKREGS